MSKIIEKRTKKKFFLPILINLVAIATITIILTTVLSNCLICSPKKQDTLVLVQVVFRHGDRTPEPGTMYKSDPYQNFSFYPENYGELTQRGRKVAYNIGKLLRQRYDHFLGTSYHSNLVKSYVSGYDRTQMTLQCVHAGLFSNEISPLGLPWRPITYHVFDFNEDHYIGIMAHCKKLIMPHVKPTDSATIDLFKFLTEKTEEPIETYSDVIHVGNTFHVETRYGLKLPNWTNASNLEAIHKAEMTAWGMFTRDNLRFGAGGLLKMITDGATRLIHHEHGSGIYERKLYLYSGHDYNLLFLMKAMGLMNEDRSEFGAYMVFELHKINGEYGFKIFYNNYKNVKDGHRQLSPPFCKLLDDSTSFCGLHEWIKHTQWMYLPPPEC